MQSPVRDTVHLGRVRWSKLLPSNMSVAHLLEGSADEFATTIASHDVHPAVCADLDNKMVERVSSFGLFLEEEGPVAARLVVIYAHYVLRTASRFNWSGSSEVDVQLLEWSDGWARCGHWHRLALPLHLRTSRTLLQLPL